VSLSERKAALYGFDTREHGLPPGASDPVISEHELSELRLLIEQRSGIVFDESRTTFFCNRLREHMQARRLASGAQLLRLVHGPGVEYDALLERMLTQETRFFRYPETFEIFQRKVLPELHMRKFWESPRMLRLWSAGCSTGEEPYSMAISVCDALEFSDAWNTNILATDISRDALRQAERSIYTRRALGNLSPRQQEMYFVAAGANEYTVKPKIRNMVSFVPMNLNQSVYVGRFDCIFCMNVLIYFSESRRAGLIQRFYDYLEPGGYLFLGHAESVAGLPVRFKQTMEGGARLLQKPMNLPPLARAAAEETL
jgi:chemotaxis protein methyltransferase CheR